MNKEGIKAKIINRQMLTENVIEITLESYQELIVTPGQWALFQLEDAQGRFQRAYSIVDQDTDNEKTMLVFVIKLSDTSRSSPLIKNMHIGNEVVLTGIFGHFVLQNTEAPKVFIGTGVGIAPLLNMAKYCTSDKRLLFSVSYKKDLFYEDRIKKIHGLAYDIHLSQENIPGYSPGRIDLTKTEFDPSTEFYICGNPEMVNDMTNKLSKVGYKNIYTEKF